VSWLFLVVRTGWGEDATEVAVFEPVAVAFEGDDFGVVGQLKLGPWSG
jgi:hypothetical protein